MRIKILSIVFFLGTMQVSAQHKQPVHTIDYSKISTNGITISKSIIDSIQAQTNKTFEPLKFYHWKDSFKDAENYGHFDSSYHGICIKRVNDVFARQIFEQYYTTIKKEGNYIYLTHFNFDSLSKVVYDLAIVQAASQFDVVERVGTQALNYDIKNARIIEKLKQWDAEVSFKIIVADDDRVEAFMLNKPKDLKKLAKEIYEFCPDVIDQGYGSMKAMLKDYRKNSYFWLWWD